MIKPLVILLAILILLSGIVIWNNQEKIEVKKSRTYAPWPMYHQNPKNTGESPYSTTNNNGNILWKFYVNHSACFQDSVAIDSDGTIYVKGDKLYAVNPNGTFKWEFNADMRTGPSVDANGHIYFVANIAGNYTATVLYCLDKDGNLLWNYTVNNIVETSITIANNTLYFGTFEGNLYAMNLDGSVKWIFNDGLDDPACRIYGTPAVGNDGTIYFPAYDYYFFAVYPNGEQKWSTSLYSTCDTTPVIGSNGLIYVAADVYDNSWHKNVYALNEHGSKVYESPDVSTEGGNWWIVPAITTNNTIYVIGDNMHTLYALNEDLAVRWNITERDIYFTSSPTVDSNGIIYVTDTTSVFAIYPNSTIKWQTRMDKSSSDVSIPAIDSNGNIILVWDKNLTSFGNQSIPEFYSTSYMISFSLIAMAAFIIFGRKNINE